MGSRNVYDSGDDRVFAKVYTRFCVSQESAKRSGPVKEGMEGRCPIKCNLQAYREHGKRLRRRQSALSVFAERHVLHAYRSLMYVFAPICICVERRAAAIGPKPLAARVVVALFVRSMACHRRRCRRRRSRSFWHQRR